jgi:hypothetical protein
MNLPAEAKTTYRLLVDKHPRSGEAKLANERLRELESR